MSHDFTIDFNGKYIHMIHAPEYEICPESNEKMWKELSKACKKYNCRKVLAEGPKQKRRITTIDAFKSGSQASESIPGLKLAICVYEYITDETTEFFKTVAFNRGVHIEFFKDKKKALKWLGIKDTD
jgi:hypothetical protein